jgi:hypothetical protein
MQLNRIPVYRAVSAKSGEQIEEAFLEIVKFVTSEQASKNQARTIEIGLTDPNASECC